MLNYPKNFPVVGVIYPRIFLRGTYENRRIQPIKRIIGNYTTNITWTIRPIRDDFGPIYKAEYLRDIGKRHDVIVKYFTQDCADEITSFPYIDTVYCDHITEDISAFRMISVCSKIDGGYIGTPEDVWAYENRNITRVQKADPTHNVCSIGYNVDEDKWYGWSHRAMYGFGIGSVVKKGDCAYVPNNADAMADDLRCSYETMEYSNLSIKTQVDGVRVKYTYGDLGYDQVAPYPAEWGKGEWTATTIEEAKQMAIDFADGVG